MTPAVTGMRFATRIAKTLAGNEWPAPTDSKKTTFGGALQAEFLDLANAFFAVETDRAEVYRELDELNDNCVEFTTALTILADEAVNSEGGTETSFKFDLPDSELLSAKTVLDNLARRAMLARKAIVWARDALLYGDVFLQVVIGTSYGNGYQVDRVVEMPVREMVRHEDPSGLLRRGNTPETAAYTQVREGKVVGAFYPWQIIHLRWQSSEQSLYGRSLGYAIRSDWRKLKAMEEALVINWLTRAFARLLFTVDVTGLDRKDAETVVKTFKEGLLSRKGAAGDVQQQAATVVKDLFIGNGYIDEAGKLYPGLTNVSVLDTANTGFYTLDPVKYYQTKILEGCQVPKAFVGLEQDINAKSTLVEQGRRFARTVRRVQQLLSTAIIQIADIELILQDYNPAEVDYKPVWPNPSRLDETEASTIHLANARADALYASLRVIDAEWLATHRYELTPEQFAKVQAQAKKEVSNAQSVRPVRPGAQKEGDAE